MRTATALLVFVTVAGSTAADPLDRAKLRELAQLPTVSFFFGVGFNSEDGLVLLGEKVDASAEIAAVNKQMKGDASDAERYQRLVRLYGMQQKDLEKKVLLAKAAELYRQRVKAEPKNGRLLTQLAQTVQAAEAELLLRQAVKVSPDDWRCWLMLARFLDERAVDALFGEELKRKTGGLDMMLQILMRRPVAGELLQKVTRQREEARACYERAAALAGPRDAEPFTRRAASNCFFNFVEAGLDLARGKRVNPFLAMFSADCLPDLREAIKRDPEDYKALSLAFFVEVLPTLITQEKPLGDGGLWKHLPEKSQRSARERFDRLEELSRHRDARTAASAAEVLGVFSFFVRGDMTRMTTEFLRAVSRDPSRDHAWEGLIVALAETGRPEEAEAVCRERLRRNDSAYFRLLLAKVLAEREHFRQAEEELRAALKLEPNSSKLHVGLAVLLLKRGDTDLPAAGQLLDQAEKLLGESAASNERGELLLTRSLHLALSGKADEARDRLRLLLSQDEKNKHAREALAVLENGLPGSYKLTPSLPPVPRRP